jgi:hypothetical protein
MKIKRNLSGIYFRVKNEETGKFDNIVFEDLSEQQQDEMMKGRSEEWLKSLAKQLASTLNIIGEQLDITGE